MRGKWRDLSVARGKRAQKLPINVTQNSKPPLFLGEGLGRCPLKTTVGRKISRNSQRKIMVSTHFSPRLWLSPKKISISEGIFRRIWEYSRDFNFISVNFERIFQGISGIFQDFLSFKGFSRNLKGIFTIYKRILHIFRA